MSEFTKISKKEMGEHLDRLKNHAVEDRYTTRQMAFLTGWTETWLIKLEKKGLIPKAKRSGEAKLGIVKTMEKRHILKRGTTFPNNYGKKRFWDEDDARAIMAFRQGQHLNGNR